MVVEGVGWGEGGVWEPGVHEECCWRQPLEQRSTVTGNLRAERCLGCGATYIAGAIDDDQDLGVAHFEVGRALCAGKDADASLDLAQLAGPAAIEAEPWRVEIRRAG